MFQLEWANKESIDIENPFSIQHSAIKHNDVLRVLHLQWEEHCVECAVPECYSTCNLYVARKDGACARFIYGINPDKNFNGHFNFGADITFRKWGKLEADLNQSFPGGDSTHARQQSFNLLSRDTKTVIRNKFLSKYPFSQNSFDAFVIECYSYQTKSFSLILEHFTEKNRFRTTRYRKSFIINQGYNYVSIPFTDFNMESLEGYIYLYPENHEPEKRLIFTWLDFIAYKNQNSTPQSLIKCVAWDLDDTLWKGILSEDKDISLNKEAASLIPLLDKRGILQTIVSKNNFEPAWLKLKSLGLDHYFLHPAINWGQKSENLKAIALKLNIDINSFAVIDDSPFERDEIKSALPSIRVYSENLIAELLTYKEFNSPVTQASGQRRESYQSAQIRDSIKSTFSGSYEDFLESCEMKVTAFIPVTDADILRCWELLQRSNQLNLSTKRYSLDELHALLSSNDLLSVAIKCSDKFGDYGIIGFSSIEFLKLYPIVIDFVLSCRVAQKKIEHAYIKNLSSILVEHGYDKLTVKFIETGKNLPLRQVFYDIPFQVIDDSLDTIYLRLDLKQTLPVKSIMEFQIDNSIKDFLVKQQARE